MIFEKLYVPDLSEKAFALFLHYGQLILFALVLIGLFFFYEIYLQDWLAMFLATTDFRPVDVDTSLISE